MAKALKFHQTLNLPPRSVKHGKHRRANPTAYRGSAIRTDTSTGGSDAGGSVWVSFPSGTFTWYGVDFAAEPKHPTLPYAGLRTGEIIGHRLWWVIKDGGEQWICSLAHRQLWAPNETLSADLEKPVNGPWLLHTIWGGIYAFNDNPLEIEHETSCMLQQIAYASDCDRLGFKPITYGWHGIGETRTFVRGTVKMWGEVIEHETGWRSQFAKLNSIDQMYGPGDIDSLRARYFGNDRSPKENSNELHRYRI